MVHPVIIQGGMGVAVSNWRLARAVSQLGELGVISGTLLAVILARRLADGDPHGDVRRALSHLPVLGVAERILGRYFIPGGKAPDAAYAAVPMPTLDPNPFLTELTIAANFVEVFLAKEGHSGRIGINLLEKVQLATLPSLLGAMLAGVDYVLMGAGIPRGIPGVLDRFAAGEAAELKIDVDGARPGEEFILRLDPQNHGLTPGRALHRPHFIAIVSSATLALTLAKKSNGRVDGFIVEGDTAGGHNAPPRGPLQLTDQGEPLYGPRDIPDLEKIRAIGLPFWLAGAQARPEKLAEARAIGANGIQVGTAFAFCRESGMTDRVKADVINASRRGTVRVFTDPAASPTGFPFKVVQLPGTLAETDCFAARDRICDLGYLRQPYRKDDGSVGYRCAAEPVADFERKGGNALETVGRKCLCNGLAATVGYGQVRHGTPEPVLVTAGNEVTDVARFVSDASDQYAAEDVVRYLRGPGSAGVPPASSRTS
ncbi:nitronate monooxygenase [Horticoccus sp. 23ND18S-11]|uniref:nitronate monooxygenase n=1 Tax=Horticoccus sp. 23ND18S-11 TaxID=3391832 RepID=UPI0039C9B1BA